MKERRASSEGRCKRGALEGKGGGRAGKGPGEVWTAQDGKGETSGEGRGMG